MAQASCSKCFNTAWLRKYHTIWINHLLLIKKPYFVLQEESPKLASHPSINLVDTLSDLPGPTSVLLAQAIEAFSHWQPRPGACLIKRTQQQRPTWEGAAKGRATGKETAKVPTGNQGIRGAHVENPAITSAKSLRLSARKSCQLWIVSYSAPRLTPGHIEVTKEHIVDLEIIKKGIFIWATMTPSMQMRPSFSQPSQLRAAANGNYCGAGKILTPAPSGSPGQSWLPIAPCDNRYRVPFRRRHNRRNARRRGSNL